MDNKDDLNELLNRAEEDSNEIENETEWEEIQHCKIKVTMQLLKSYYIVT